MSVRRAPGTTPSAKRIDPAELDDGRRVERFTLRAGALEMDVMSLGATITALRAPDRDSHLDDVVLGFDASGEYVAGSPYFGAVIGRCGNRIARGRFKLDGCEYQLATNNGANHLHGGVAGFDKVLWHATEVERIDSAGVVFTRTSPDGEEGYPGTVDVRVEYLLTERNELAISYHATTDRATIVNLTQHSYWDLSAGRAPDVGSHELTLFADAMTPVDAGLIPTGELRLVAGTPFDFRHPVRIGERVGDPDTQLRHAGGYDHNFVLRAPVAPGDMVRAAHLRDPLSGRTLDVHTTEPGLQFYSGNFLDGTLRGKGGRVYGHRAGLCLETQHFPDAPNHAAFPSVSLRPGDVYRSRTVYTFGADA